MPEVAAEIAGKVAEGDSGLVVLLTVGVFVFAALKGFELWSSRRSDERVTLSRSEGMAMMSRIDEHVKSTGRAVTECSHQIELMASAVGSMARDVEHLSEAVRGLNTQITIMQHDADRRGA